MSFFMLLLLQLHLHLLLVLFCAAFTPLSKNGQKTARNKWRFRSLQTGR